MRMFGVIAKRRVLAELVDGGLKPAHHKVTKIF